MDKSKIYNKFIHYMNKLNQLSFFNTRRTITCKTKYLFHKGVKFCSAPEFEVLFKFDLSTV